MGRTVAVTTRPDPTLTGPRRTLADGTRRPTCRYLRGRGQFTTRCTEEPVSDPNLDDLALCARHLGLAIAAYQRIAATITTRSTE